MKTAYVAHNFSAKDWLKTVASDLLAVGIAVNSRWIHTPLMAGKGGKQAAIEDLEDIKDADFLIYFAPGWYGSTGLGKHIELGYALGLGKRVVLVRDHPFGSEVGESVFYLLDGVTQFQDAGKFIDAVAKGEFVP